MAWFPRKGDAGAGRPDSPALGNKELERLPYQCPHTSESGSTFSAKRSGAIAATAVTYAKERIVPFVQRFFDGPTTLKHAITGCGSAKISRIASHPRLLRSTYSAKSSYTSVY
jgi:hypothetical protein